MGATAVSRVKTIPHDKALMKDICTPGPVTGSHHHVTSSRLSLTMVHSCWNGYMFDIGVKNKQHVKINNNKNNINNNTLI